MDDICNVVIIESRDVVAEGMTSILERHGFKVLEIKSTMRQIENASDDNTFPHIILVDLASGDEGDLRGLERIRLIYPNARIVLLVTSLDKVALDLVMSAPVYSIMSTSITGSALVYALKLVAAGERIFPPPWTFDALLPGKPVSSAPADLKLVWSDSRKSIALKQLKPELSAREAEVLDCLAHGDPNKLVARKLGISEATVKVHVKAILRKMGARNRTEVALIASHLESKPEGVELDAHRQGDGGLRNTAEPDSEPGPRVSGDARKVGGSSGRMPKC